MSFESAVAEKVKYILQQDREFEWKVFRESLQDPSLSEAHADKFVINMRAAYLQLLGGAMMRALGGPAALTNNLKRVLQMRDIIEDSLSSDPCAEQIEELKSFYNSAYGSSSSNGIDAMTHEFSRLVSDGKMSSRACQYITEHFTAVWASMIDDFSRIKVDTTITRSSIPKGGGCLMIATYAVTICIIAIIIVTLLS